jgi:hypothetical protein
MSRLRKNLRSDESMALKGKFSAKEQRAGTARSANGGKRNAEIDYYEAIRRKEERGSVNPRQEKADREVQGARV